MLPTRSRSESATSIVAPRSVRGTISMPSRSLRSERSSSVCNSVGSPARRSVHGDLGRAWSDDRHVPWDTGPDVGDQRWRDIGERQRDDVVRPGDQSLGGLVGSDDDEQVHGDMLVHLRRLCLGTGLLRGAGRPGLIGRGRPSSSGVRPSASDGPGQCVGRAGPVRRAARPKLNSAANLPPIEIATGRNLLAEASLGQISTIDRCAQRWPATPPETREQVFG